MKLLRQILCLGFLLAGSAYATLPATLLFNNYVLTPSHKIDTRYPDGNDGTADIPLTIQPVPDISVPCNVNYSLPFRSAYITEAGSPNSTLTLLSGSLPAGWALNTDTLDLTATGSGSALISIRATRSGQTGDSNLFNLGCTTAVGSDTTAPTVPTGLAIVNNTGSVTATFDAASDPYYTAPGSGVASYDVYLNGANPQNVPGTAGLAYQLTTTQLGSFTPTATATQQSDGVDWTQVGAGAIDGTSDLAGFTGTSVTGDASMTVKVNSVTANGATFPKVGLMVRDSIVNANSRYFACYDQSLNLVQARKRDTDGGTANTAAQITGQTLPIWLNISRVGNAFTCRLSTDGNTWTNVSANYSLAMSNAAQWGMVTTSSLGSGGAASTGVFQQFNLNNVARVSATYNTNTAGPITVRANDVAGNHSAVGAGVTGTPVVPSDTTPPVYCDYYIGASGSDGNAGTYAAPWAITAINSKQATYAGKRLCLIDGTYNIYSLLQAGTGDGYLPVLNVRGGAAGAPTIIQALNPRAAILECSNSGTITTVNSPAIGQVSMTPMGYVTLDGLKLQNCGSKVIEFGGSGGLAFPSQYAGWTVQNMEVSGQNTSAFSAGNNFSALEIIGGISPLIFNNYIHGGIGNVGAADGNHFSSTIQWYTSGATYQNNSLVGPGLYAKETGNQGTTITLNYIDNSAWTGVFAFQDFAGSTGVTQPTSVTNNVFISRNPADLEASLGGNGWFTALDIHNNTFIADAATGFNNSGVRAMGQSGNTRFWTFYNNVFYDNGHAATSYGNVTTSISGMTLVDYNLYGTALWFSVPNGTYTSAGGTTYSTLANWRTAMAGSTGAEAHSSISSNYAFTGTGSGPALWKLQNTSDAYQTGRVGGVSIGAVANMGAYASLGQTEVIGQVTPTASVVLPSGAASGQTAINWSCGTATDASGIRGYIPSTATSSGGTYTDRAEQVSSAYTQSGLSAGTTYYFKCKPVDLAGNVGAYSPETSAATSGSSPPAFTAPTVSSVTATSTTALTVTSTSVAGAGTYLLRQSTTGAVGAYTYLSAYDSPNLSVAVTGLTQGTNYCYERAAATADKSTIGPWSTGVCQNTASTSGTIKWHPGAYIWLDPNATQTNNFAVIDDISANCGNCLGVSVLLSWGGIEKTINTYTYTNIDAYLNKCLAANNTGHRNLRFILRLKMQEYNGTTGSYPGSYPAYLNSSTYDFGVDVAPTGTTGSGGLTSAVKLWDPLVMARVKTLSAALAARYESNQYFEGFDPLGETAIGETWPGGGTYTTSGYITQTESFYQVARTQWTTTQLRVQPNFMGTDQQMHDYMVNLSQYQVLFGGPDSLPETVGSTQSNYVFRGLNYNGTRGSSNPAFADQRGIYGWIAEEQTYNRYASTNTQLWTYAHDTMHMNYHMWAYQTWQNTGTNEWAQVRPFIAAGSDTMYSTSCPTSYLSGCNTQ